MENCTGVNASLTDCNSTGFIEKSNEQLKLLDTAMVPSLWGAVFLAGIAGNSLVVYVMLRFGDVNTTNCYIINLAATDLVFTIIVIPFTMMHYIMPSWIFGRGMCKFHMYMIYVCLHATCLTLTAMSIDRYFAIVHPIKSIIHRTPKVAVIVSAATWIVSFLASVPFGVFVDLMIDNQRGPRIVFCRERWPSIFAVRASQIYVVIVTYIIPLSVIMVCYSLMLKKIWRNKSSIKPSSNQQSNRASDGSSAMTSNRIQGQKRRKAAKMVGVVILLFATCWLPIHIFQLWTKYDKDFPRTQVTYIYKILAHALSYANSCVNPIIYSFLGDGFRKAVRKAFPRIFQNTNQPQASTSMNATTSRRDEDGNTVSSAVPPPDSIKGTLQHEMQARNDLLPRQPTRVLYRQMSLPGTVNRSQVLAAVQELTV